jgi:hypothetical protein
VDAWLVVLRVAEAVLVVFRAFAKRVAGLAVAVLRVVAWVGVKVPAHRHNLGTLSASTS